MVLGMNTIIIGDPFETLSGFYEAIDGSTVEVPRAGAKKIKQYAQYYVAKDTWALHDSIRVEDNMIMAGGPPLTGDQRNPTKRDYAWFQEYGTSKNEAKPYIRPAIERASPIIQNMLVSAGANGFKENHDVVTITVAGIRSIFNRKKRRR